MSKWELNNAITRTIASLRHNGPRRMIKQWWTIHDPKIGTKVGQDEMGNEYYENLNEEWGRERWVEYKDWSWPAKADYVTPRWHGWLSHINDEPEVPKIQVPKYAIPFQPNLTGTRGAYKPYSTTISKMSAWEPGVKERQG